MIGNDIIDLRFAETESNWQRKGFLDKQFTSREQVVIKSSEDPFMKVWQFWSMKEAAYKIYTQLTEERFFAPKKFECEFTSGSKGIVCFQNQKFYTTSILNRTYIFTVAGLEKEIKNSSSIGSPNEIDQSIKRKLQKETGISISEIEVEDVTDELRSEFSDSDFIAKKLTASAVFELIDPIPRRHRNRLVDVTIWETWSNYTWSCRPEKPRDNAYLDVSFSSFLGRDSEVLAFEIGPDGALTYRIPLFFTHFREPFTPTQRRALGRCIFNGACEPRNLYSLRNLEPVSR